MNSYTVKHRIQKHILSTLTQQKFARFRDMRPPTTETNLYSYHLKLLQQAGLVIKTDLGYTLGQPGLLYAAQTADVPPMPTIAIMLVVQNSEGDVLLQQHTRQPHIGAWGVPSDLLGNGATSLLAAARQLCHGSLGVTQATPEHAGDCYVRLLADGEVTVSRLNHVFRLESDAVAMTDQLHWARPHKLGQYELAPATESIIARTFFRDPHFFEEYDVAW